MRLLLSRAIITGYVTLPDRVKISFDLRDFFPHDSFLTEQKEKVNHGMF